MTYVNCMGETKDIYLKIQANNAGGGSLEPKNMLVKKMATRGQLVSAWTSKNNTSPALLYLMYTANQTNLTHKPHHNKIIIQSFIKRRQPTNV